MVYFWWKICMHQIFDVWNFIAQIKACVHYFYFCYQNKTFKKLSKKLFVLQKNTLLPLRFYQIFIPHSFPLFAFLGHCWFYRRSWLMINPLVYNIFMDLNWILKTQILSYTWPVDRVLYWERFQGKMSLSLGQPKSTS